MLRAGLVAALLLLAAGPAAAQVTQPFQIDLVTPLVRFGSIDPARGLDQAALTGKFDARAPRLPLPHWTEAGIGVRGGYRTSSSFAIEAELDLFPRYRGGSFVPVPADLYDHFRGWGKSMLLVGPRIGRQFEKFAVSGKVRPGLLHFGGFPAVQTVEGKPETGVTATISDEASATFGVVDIGGVFEFMTHTRYVIRADAGDLIVLYRPSPIDLNRGFVRHNLQITASIGVRF